MNTITIRPSAIYALLMVFPINLLALFFLGLAYRLLPASILISVFCSTIAFYRYWKIRKIVYTVDAEVLHIATGIFLRRTDSLELYRVKDYIITRNLLLQLLGLMNLTLLTTDLTNPVTILKGIPKSDLPDIIRERVQRARQNSKIVELN
ncbi:PH domain-containing protein [Mucilaginibacter sp. HC2]|jgi:uncharacterized membrane protein YdbT with pleckstrin-like domain|uniref:PH domain-containing protein n=1 Tax=Mucilaginibacter inviolabilis TaxID=2714892 RepID=UPI001408EE46|nr:PH domain-containing protein [Mucilaginibacter inviolabilis]NHA02551.1 PH domain-containing protein [Mucilaginibacter inviolabilis]